MDKIDIANKDIVDVLKEIEEKINEIVDWINSRG
tara:strand:+ start:340 stop:441 length:102 start_codon:yes stop_codon:yes gene_type:complete